MNHSSAGVGSETICVALLSTHTYNQDSDLNTKRSLSSLSLITNLKSNLYIVFVNETTTAALFHYSHCFSFTTNSAVHFNTPKCSVCIMYRRHRYYMHIQTAAINVGHACVCVCVCVCFIKYIYYTKQGPCCPWVFPGLCCGHITYIRRPTCL